MKHTLALVLLVFGIVGCSQDSSLSECAYQKSKKCKTDICSRVAYQSCELKYKKIEAKKDIKECKRLDEEIGRLSPRQIPGSLISYSYPDSSKLEKLKTELGRMNCFEKIELLK